MEIYAGQRPKKSVPLVTIQKTGALWISRTLGKALGWKVGDLVEFVIMDGARNVVIRKTSVARAGTRRITDCRHGQLWISTKSLMLYLRVPTGRSGRLPFSRPRADELSVNFDPMSRGAIRPRSDKVAG